MQTYRVVYRGDSFMTIGATMTSLYKAESINAVLRHFANTGIPAHQIVSITIEGEK